MGAVLAMQTAGRPLVDDAEAIGRSVVVLVDRIDDLREALIAQAAAQREPLGARARQLIAYRRTRDRYFPAGLFHDPHWDILLELYSAGEAGRPVSVSSACIAAAVPSTSALRAITRLQEAGLVERRADHHDRRRAFVSLTPAARLAIDGYLTAIAAPDRPGRLVLREEQR